MGSALQDRAALGQLSRGGQRVGLDDGVARCHGSSRAIADLATLRDLLGRRGKGIAAIDHGAAQLGKPACPRLHDPSLLGLSRCHATAATVNKYKVCHFYSLFLLDSYKFT